MSKKICLTAKQQEAFNFIKRFHRENGRFPNSTQLASGLGKKVGPGTFSQVTQLYGALLLKGAFTDGTPVSDGIYDRHSGGNIAALNIAQLTFKTQKVERAVPTRTPAQLRQTQVDVQKALVAAALRELLNSSPSLRQLVAQG